jgi:hypothetical protein
MLGTPLLADTAPLTTREGGHIFGMPGVPDSESGVKVLLEGEVKSAMLFSLYSLC